MKMCVALSVSGIFASTCSQPFPYACTGSPSLFVSCLCYPLPVALFPGVLCLFVPWIFMSKYLTTHLQLLFCVCIICYMYLPQHLPLYTLHLGHLTTPVSLLILHIQNPCRVSGFLMCSHCFLNIFQCKRKRENKTKQNTVLIQIYIFLVWNCSHIVMQLSLNCLGNSKIHFRRPQRNTNIKADRFTVMDYLM